MKKYIILGAALLALVACKPTEEQKQNLKKVLPEGCVAHDIGKYGEIDRLLIITCKGKIVTSSYSSDVRSNGKTSSKHQSAVFVIEG